MGVLTYLLNESLLDKEHKGKIVKLFRKRKNTKFDISEYKIGRERSCVTKSLKLDIDWIDPILEYDKGNIDEFHFLLAIASKPMTQIPSSQDIAQTVKSDKKRKYFINNLINGIITHDDFEISKFL